MITRILRHISGGRHFAALIAVLGMLFTATAGAWHLEHPIMAAGLNDQTTVSAFLGYDALQVDVEKSKPGAKGNQDCASHCEQHGRSLPHTVASLDKSMPTAPKLLVLRDNGFAVAWPDGLLEPPKA